MIFKIKKPVYTIDIINYKLVLDIHNHDHIHPEHFTTEIKACVVSGFRPLLRRGNLSLLLWFLRLRKRRSRPPLKILIDF